MNITEKLRKLHEQATVNGYIPSTIGVTDEKYEAYAYSLKEMAELIGLVWTDKPSKLSYKGIELKKYGKQHTDEKRKKTSKDD